MCRSILQKDLTLGVPTGLWSSREKEGFEKSKESSELYSWRGVKDFKNCDLHWFFRYPGNYYFNAKGNVYSISSIEPFYELVWENCQILQLTSGLNDDCFACCLLDNGKIWVTDDPNYDFFADEEEIITIEEIEWIHLPEYDDKNVKCAIAMDSIIYLLCENPKQTLFYHSPTHFPNENTSSEENGENEENEENDENEENKGDSEDEEVEDEENEDEEVDHTSGEDNTMDSKTIIKMVALPEIVLCWCVEGLYAWIVNNGGSPFPDTEMHPIYKKPSQFYPYKFFDDKNILDIGVSVHLYVLCDDGVYTIPSIFDEKDSNDKPIAAIKLPIFDENLPVIFSSYLAKSKLGKSARSRIDEIEQSAIKKQKIDNDE